MRTEQNAPGRAGITDTAGGAETDGFMLREKRSEKQAKRRTRDVIRSAGHKSENQKAYVHRKIRNMSVSDNPESFYALSALFFASAPF